ncbi:hypothetical protein tb265_30550 [Gemmatimonadetes bacterium T265]|nr:hypothetical protein tb265_30550 [Gemmatimonadetes bacterium T265]
MSAVPAPPADAGRRADAPGEARAGAAGVSGREARSRRLAAAVVVAAVLAGGAIGVAADRLVLARGPVEAPRGLDAFAAELDLTPPQRSAIDSIMDARRQAIDALIAPVRPQLDAIRAAGRRDIRQRLTPAQQERYDAYVARLERQEREERAHRR